MFGLGLGELILIALAALVFVGPKRLPELGKKAGKGFRQLKDAAETVKTSVLGDLDD